MTPEALPQRLGPLTIQSRIDQFLLDLTGPLLAIPEQEQMMRVFRGLTEICLADTQAVRTWNSDLCSDGVPMEFSIVIESNADASFRYIVDPPGGVQDTPSSAQSLRKWADLVVPYRDKCSGLIDELLRSFPATIPNLPDSYLAFGARFAPGIAQAGRLYFKTTYTPVDRVYAFLSSHLDREDMRLLQGSGLVEGSLIGVGFDFHSGGLGRVKAYVMIDRLTRQTTLDLLERTLGKPGLEQQIDKISRQKNPFWVIPQTLVAVGFRLGTGSRDIKITLPATQWEWHSFSDLWPVIASVLSEWGIPVGSEPFPQSSGKPYWRFTPTWLSIDGSAKTGSLSIYFKPMLEDCASIAAKLCSRYIRTGENSSCEEKNRRGVRVFEAMFGELLRADAKAGASGPPR